MTLASVKEALRRLRWQRERLQRSTVLQKGRSKARPTDYEEEEEEEKENSYGISLTAIKHVCNAIGDFVAAEPNSKISLTSILVSMERQQLRAQVSEFEARARA